MLDRDGPARGRPVEVAQCHGLDVPCINALPLGFVPPCLPTKTPQPPTGDGWLHEIKHDGFRVVARKDGDRVRLYSRPGNELTYRFQSSWKRSPD